MMMLVSPSSSPLLLLQLLLLLLLLWSSSFHYYIAATMFKYVHIVFFLFVWRHGSGGAVQENVCWYGRVLLLVLRGVLPVLLCLLHTQLAQPRNSSLHSCRHPPLIQLVSVSLVRAFYPCLLAYFICSWRNLVIAVSILAVILFVYFICSCHNLEITVCSCRHFPLIQLVSASLLSFSVA